MYSNPIKKLFGLLALYAIIIVGIFVLQFKTESVFSENIGNLRFTLTKSESDNESHLKNSLQATFKGVLFYFDDKTPVMIKKSTEETPEDITLISWNKASPLISTFNFTEDVTLSFALTNSTESADLIIHADFPDDIEYVSLKFKPTKGYHVTDKKNSSVNIETQNGKFILTGIEFADDQIVFLKNHPMVAYSAVNESDAFTFAASTSFELASADLYNQNLKTLESNIQNLFQDALLNNTMITEQTAISYVAVMAKAGQYNSALDKVPDTFKKGQRRTYLSAPYFNTLEKMYATLEMQLGTFSRSVNHAIEQNSCDVFTIPKITDYILLNRKKQITKDIFSVLSDVQTSQINVSQAVGILNAYTVLSISAPELAINITEPLRSACLEKIEQSCIAREENKKLSIMENLEENVSFTPAKALEAGNTLVKYGRFISNTEVIHTGYLLVNSYFADIPASDLYTFAEIYPVLVSDNPFYPHFEFIGEDNENTVWAWTCASEVNYKKDEYRNTEIEIVFPQGLTHYVIIGGIPAFQKIQIYGIDFRTDPRFETYNSSGYVHLKNSDILLLKSRHRNERETVRLTYAPPVPVPPPVAAESASGINASEPAAQ